MAGILSGSSILYAIESGDIEIDPFNASQVNPASYDLTLGSGVAVYKEWVSWDDRADELHKMGVRGPRDGSDLTPMRDRVFDVKTEPEVLEWTIDQERGWVLKPGVCYLMHTHERICTKKYVPILDGKSSIGRLFLKVHECAGFGDPGYDGQYTLEVTVQHPLRVYSGMRICQIRFHTIDGQVESYQKKGSYKGALAKGPVPSQAWRMFLK